METYGVWGLSLPSLRRRLFRCVSIRETRTAPLPSRQVQHVPEKEAIVDNGASFEPHHHPEQRHPPAVQHLTVEVSAADGQYLRRRNGTRRSGEGRELYASLTVVADDGSERLVSTARDDETTYRFTQLAPELQADSPGGKCVGAAGRSGVGIVPDCRTGSAVTD